MQGSSNRRVLLLDTAAFISATHLYVYDRLLYTTPSVLDEVKDFESVQRLSLSQSADRIVIVEPSKEYIEKALSLARKFGALDKLSRTDLEVLALALQLVSEGYDVTVLTDDYDLQKILKGIGIEFKPIKTIGIR
ncbi:MAG: DNA-binding protein [Ignisphaera sp.]